VPRERRDLVARGGGHVDAQDAAERATTRSSSSGS
jgi:hypothetical protein